MQCTFIPLYTVINFSFADYLCSDLINKEELSTSCKENEDPEETVLKAPKNSTVPQPKLPDGKKSAKNAKSEDDAFEDDDDDDVFQQYMLQTMEKASTSEPNPPETNTNEEKKQGKA